MSEEEEKEFLSELRKVLYAFMPNPADVARKYKKGLSVNKFSNFKNVMETLHQRKSMSQKNVVNKHKCKRDSCQQKAETFYMKPNMTQVGNHNMSFMEDEYSNDYGASPLYSQKQMDTINIKTGKRGLSTQL